MYFPLKLNILDPSEIFGAILKRNYPVIHNDLIYFFIVRFFVKFMRVDLYLEFYFISCGPFGEHVIALL